MHGKRPGGSGQLKVGTALMVISFIALLLGAAADVTTATGDIDVGEAARRSSLFLASGGMFALGLTLLCVGWIIQAIHHLPEHEQPVADEASTEPAPIMSPTASAFVLLFVIAIVGFIAQQLLATPS